MNRPGRTLGSVCLTVVAAVWSSQPIAATPPPVTPAPTDSPVAVAVPRSVAYAGTEWTIDGAAWAPGDDVVAPSIRLGFRVVNRLEQYGLTVPVELLAIETPDGGLVRGTRLEGTPSEYRVELGSGTTAAGTAVFELAPGTGVIDVARVSFVIDEAGRTPAVLPLAGPVPPDPYPLSVAVTGTSGPILGSCSDGTVEIIPTGAVVDLDLGPQRADEGRRFLTVDLRLVAVAGGLGIACVGGPFFRLVAGDETLQPVDGTSVSETLDVGATFDTSVTFSIPSDVATVALGIGADGATAVTIPITIEIEVAGAPSSSSDT